MQDILRTNDPVRLSYAQALLRDAGVDCILFDIHASVMDGSVIAIPRRLMVADEDADRARQILRDGLEA
jgi:hypothetical protein